MLTRALIVLLVVLNLGVALWWITRVDAADGAARVELPGGIARLQLASEAPRATAATVAVESAQPDADEVGPDGRGADDRTGDAATAESVARCYALGPFETAAAVAAAEGAVAGRVRGMRMRQAPAANAAWRVVMPALADRAAAMAMAERLRQAGFNDLFVVAGGAEANSIALGRFGGEAGARSHGEALRQAGFDVRAEPVGGASRHWLDVAVAADVDVTALRRTAAATRADAVDCGTLR